MELFVCSPDDFHGWQEDRFVFDAIEGDIISSDVLSRRDVDTAIERYNHSGNMFWESWDMLSNYERSIWLVSWMAYWKDSARYLLYKDYSNRDSYFKCEVISPEGEELVIFGLSK